MLLTLGNDIALVAATVVAMVMVATAAGHPSPIDGQWQSSATPAQLTGKGQLNASWVTRFCGRAAESCPVTIEFSNGRVSIRSQRSGHLLTGTFTLSGNLVRFVYSGGDMGKNSANVCAWSLFRDRLTITRTAGRQCNGWPASALTRSS